MVPSQVPATWVQLPTGIAGPGLETVSCTCLNARRWLASMNSWPSVPPWPMIIMGPAERGLTHASIVYAVVGPGIAWTEP